MTERTLILIKPDGVERGLIGEIISRIERKGLKLTAMDLRVADKATAEKHYAEHADKPFFGELVDFITSAPLVAGVVEGPRALLGGRGRVGVVAVGLPRAAAPGPVGPQLHHRARRSGVHLMSKRPCPRREARVEEDIGGLLVADPGGSVPAQLLRVVTDDPGVTGAGEEEVVGTGAVRGQAHDAVTRLDEGPRSRAPGGLLAPQGLQLAGPGRQRSPQVVRA